MNLQLIAPSELVLQRADPVASTLSLLVPTTLPLQLSAAPVVLGLQISDAMGLSFLTEFVPSTLLNASSTAFLASTDLYLASQ